MIVSDFLPALKSHQSNAIELALKYRQLPVIMPRGSGKTRTAIELANQIKPTLPVLVIAPRTALAQWRAQILQWSDTNLDQIAIAHGDISARRLIWKHAKERRSPYRYILTTYGTVINDVETLAKIPWHMLVTDESHRMRNRTTKAFKAVKALHYQYGLFISGSIFRSQVLDIWTLLHLSDKQRFGSYWKFASRYVYVFEGEWGKEFGGPKNIKEFGRLLRERTAYVRSDELQGMLPELNRQRLVVDLNPKQQDLYDRIWEDLILEVGEGELILSQNEMVRIIRARQATVCPALLDKRLGVGAGMEAIVEHGESDPHYIIYTAFPSAIPHFEKYLRSKGYKNIYTIRGGMNINEQEEVTRDFQRNRGILLCSITVAESWEVLTCNTAYIIGYDWSPDINEQAEDRIRRVSSTHSFVNVYYICARNTYDEEGLSALNRKASNVKLSLKMTKVDS